MSKLVGSIILFVALGATSGLTAQTHLTGEAVDSALDSSLFEVGPFRLSPFLSFNSGYDSNSFSSSTAAQDDYTAHFGPGVRIVVPAGNRGFMELQPELNYVYYDEQDSLRNLNSRVALSGGIGTRRLLVQVANVFSNGITRPTSEFDIPVSVKQNEFSTSAHVLLGWRQELRLKMAVNDLTLDDSIGSLPRGQLDQLLGPRQTRYGVELHRYVSSRTRLVGVFELRNDDFDDVVARDAESRRVGRWVHLRAARLSGGHEPFDAREYSRVVRPNDSQLPANPARLGPSGLLFWTGGRCRCGRGIQRKRSTSLYLRP